MLQNFKSTGICLMKYTDKEKLIAPHGLLSQNCMGYCVRYWTPYVVKMEKYQFLVEDSGSVK